MGTIVVLNTRHVHQPYYVNRKLHVMNLCDISFVWQENSVIWNRRSIRLHYPQRNVGCLLKSHKKLHICAYDNKEQHKTLQKN